MSRPILYDDFRDLLAALAAESAQFVIVGAHALAVHGIVRATGDLDVFVRPDAVSLTLAVSPSTTDVVFIAAIVKADDFGVGPPGPTRHLPAPPHALFFSISAWNAAR